MVYQNMQNKRVKKTATPEMEVMLEDVVISKLIPDLDPMQLKYLGKNWFKDNNTGTAYHFVKSEDGATLSVKETRQSKVAQKETLRAPAKPKVEKAKTLEITCIDCGAKRIIKVQDAFQVKRCVPCQVVHRNAKRSERLKNKKAGTSIAPQA